MQVFDSLDKKIIQFAKERGAKIHSDGITYNGIPPEKIQQRRIIWSDAIVGKGIFIYPNFNTGNIDSHLYDFWNIAWPAEAKQGKGGHPFWHKCLLNAVEFSEIEKNFDKLLLQSIKNLDSVTLSDMKKVWRTRG